MTDYSNSILYIITTHNTHEMYNEIWRGGCGGKWSLSTVVNSDTFTGIKDRAPYHAWGLGGCVNDFPLRCCGISIVMKIFTLFTVLRIVSEKMLCDTVYTISHKEQKLDIGNLIPFKAGSFE